MGISVETLTLAKVFTKEYVNEHGDGAVAKEIHEYDEYSYFPAQGDTECFYVDKSTGRIYRWSGSMYVEISAETIRSLLTAANNGKVVGILNGDFVAVEQTENPLDGIDIPANNGKVVGIVNGAFAAVSAPAVYSIEPSISAIKYDPNAAIGSRLTPSSITFNSYKNQNGVKQLYRALRLVVNVYNGSNGEYDPVYNTDTITHTFGNDIDSTYVIAASMYSDDGTATLAETTIPIIAEGVDGENPLEDLESSVNNGKAIGVVNGAFAAVTMPDPLNGMNDSANNGKVLSVQDGSFAMVSPDTLFPNGDNIQY